MGQCYSHLSAEERGAIMAGKARGESARTIAAWLARSASTVVRELSRNGHREPSATPPLGRPPLTYDAVRAGARARRLARRPRRRRKLHGQSRLWCCVRRLLGKGFSPQQASCTLRRKHPDEPDWHVSHETIYTAIYAAPRGALRHGLVALLRQHKCARRPRGQGANRRGQMADLPSIHARPPEAHARLLPGHWEGDFIKGARNRSSVGVLVDRRTLFVKLVKMLGCSAEEALAGFSRAFAPLPPALRKTLTYDQGKEMALYKTLSQRTGPVDLLRRSEKSVAARHLREHQWPVASVSAEGNGSVGAQPARAGCDRAAAQHAPAGDARLSLPGGDVPARDGTRRSGAEN
jgi:IS30 family transposase